MANNGKKKSNSSSKYQKKAIKQVTKAAKKNPKGFIIAVIIIALVVGIGLAVYFLFIKDKVSPQGSSSSSETTSSEVISSSSNPSSSQAISSSAESSSSETISSSSTDSSSSGESPTYDPKITTPSGMSINFLELGCYNTGDSTYIKAGDVDILIDAGSIQSSAGTIKEFVNKYCEDGKLEYVIATHAHKDHIAGFVGTAKIPGIFESYKIGTFIDFALTNATTALYNNYVTKRDAALASGDMEHHYTAAQCIAETDGAKKEYVINDYVKMTILDQRFYHETTSDENDYSVCCLFTHNNQNHYLFTGDLEKDGEASLVELNELPHVQLFKGGHHGSKTSNTDTLLSKITPENVCICCCAGNDEYTKAVDNQFPTQTAINNIAKYTSNIFVTTVTTDGHTGYTSMNGNICFKSENGKEYTVAGSNNSVILKDTEWFKTNRTWPTA